MINENNSRRFACSSALSFSRLFRTFEHTAFRLETRDHYNAPNETEALRQFVAGKPVDLGWFQNWLTMIREMTAEGRRFTRVRVVSMPLTNYSRFGVFCSQQTNAAGEDIRYLTRDQARAAYPADPPPDIWCSPVVSFGLRRSTRWDLSTTKGSTWT